MASGDHSHLKLDLERELYHLMRT